MWNVLLSGALNETWNNLRFLFRTKKHPIQLKRNQYKGLGDDSFFCFLVDLFRVASFGFRVSGFGLILFVVWCFLLLVAGFWFLVDWLTS
jgi:hypothetical protein